MYNKINTFKKYISFFIIVTFISCERAKKDSELFFIQGNVAYKKGNYEEAIKFYSEAIEKTPEFADAYNNRGTVKMASNKLEEAIADFEKALSIDNEFILAKYNLGEAYSNTNELDKSLELLKQIESKYKDSSFYFVTLSNVLIKKNNYAEANSYLLNAIRLDKNNDKALTNLGFIHYSEKKYTEAKTSFEQAISLNPNQDLAYNNLSLIYAQQENYPKAIKLVDKAININKSVLYENNKGFYLLNIGKIEDGKKLIDNAIEADVKNAWAYRNLGVYYLLTNNYTKALENFEKSDKLDPSVELLNYYLGITQQSLGNTTKACQYWEVGQKLNEPKSIEMLAKHCRLNTTH
jgi:tetratricopeptide (TPR) repeat protein